MPKVTLQPEDFLSLLAVTPLVEAIREQPYAVPTA